MDFFVHDAVGNIVKSGSCQPETLSMNGGPGLTVVEGVASPLNQYFDIATQTVVDYGPVAMQERIKPHGPGFRWSLGQWIDERDLATAKIQKWQEIKRCQQAAELGRFTWNGNTFQCDDKSQMRLTMTAQDMAGNGPPSVEWTLEDNSVVSLSKADMKDVIKAMREHIQQQVDRAETLRAQIDAATTKEELDGISW